MVVRGEPKMSPADVMQARRYFWGRKLWTQSYFVETIGNANEEVIREYVQSQLKVMDEGERASTQLQLF